MIYNIIYNYDLKYKYLIHFVKISPKNIVFLYFYLCPILHEIQYQNDAIRDYMNMK